MGLRGLLHKLTCLHGGGTHYGRVAEVLVVLVPETVVQHMHAQ